MLRAVSLSALLGVFWFALSGRTDPYLLACGACSCFFVTALTRRAGLLDEEGHPIHLAFRAVRYVIWLLGQIGVSNWEVIRRVWSPSMALSPVVLTVPHRMRTDLGGVLYANSITLTPGTVTISLDPDRKEVLVHCLTRDLGSDLQAGRMERELRKLEGGGA